MVSPNDFFALAGRLHKRASCLRQMADVQMLPFSQVMYQNGANQLVNAAIACQKHATDLDAHYKGAPMDAKRIRRIEAEYNRMNMLMSPKVRADG